MMNEDNALFLREIQKEYLNILDDENDEDIYHKKVLTMISTGETRLLVNLNRIRSKNSERVKGLLNIAHEEMIAFQNALKEYVSSIDHSYSSKHEEFLIGFEGSFGDRHVTPRTLTSKFINNLVCCEGIVTKCSNVNPKLFRSVHFCEITNKTFERRYTDLTSLDAFPSSTVYPVKDDAGNSLETEYGFCVFKNHQRVTLQELPEKSPPGLLPRSLDVLIDNDLVDKCKPGDRVQIVGIFRCLPSKKAGYVSGSFRCVLLANYVKTLTKDADPSLTASDIKNIRKLASSRSDVFNLLSKSIAPSISGHTFIKKAILCMLIGGSEKVLDNGTRLRGDINVLLVGDPSTAKSQMLRYVLNAAPRAIATTGRGSSGVGLTAAVTNDPDTGERRLEAGAMVLGDRGVVCIDEFDKMSDVDRTALHEVMEQGRVTIAKAGIHAQLNARCSVLAAANPVHGRYDEFQTPMQNIGFQDSLLSRFDLLFTVLDTVDLDIDRQISEHVLRMRRFRATGEQEGEPQPLGTGVDFLSTENPDVEGDLDNCGIFEKRDTFLYGHGRNQRLVSIPFLKKYIYVAKQLTPELTQEASDIICRAYADLRETAQSSSQMARTLPVTARTLETLIRLSTAHAKARMSKTVDKKDAKFAVDLLLFAYFQKVQKRPRKQKQGQIVDEEGDSSSQLSDDNDRPQEVSAVTLRSESTPKDPILISPEKYSLFQEKLNNIFRENGADSLDINMVIERMDSLKSEASETFSQIEIRDCVKKMQDENKIMLSEETIFLI